MNSKGLNLGRAKTHVPARIWAQPIGKWVAKNMASVLTLSQKFRVLQKVPSEGTGQDGEGRGKRGEKGREKVS